MSDRHLFISFPAENPALLFAAEDIEQAAIGQRYRCVLKAYAQGPGNQEQSQINIGLADDDFFVNRFRGAGGKLPGEIAPEGFAVSLTHRNDQVTIWAIGGDSTGAMYAGLELAETIAENGLSEIQEKVCKPYIAKRALKINVPFDARTPAYADCGDSAQNNMAVMWDIGFWKEHLDQMARYRYNAITIWNAHPFPSLVKVPDYPDVALDDVKIADIDWRKWHPENAGFGGARGVTPDILENLKTIVKMTIQEKITFWREVMQYGHDRGIEFYIITWNIFVWGTDGKYGITDEIGNRKTIDYLRKSVCSLFETYPLLAGIGVTAGEHMTGLSPDEKERWLWESYGQGVMDARRADPGRAIRFIHRYWMSAIPDITRHFEGFDENIQFDFSFKYVKARLYAHTDPGFAEDVLRDAPKGTRWWWNLRNDDIFYFRWGDPTYVREFITQLPPADQTTGFQMGSDGYVWGREFVSREPESPRQLEIEKHWYKFMLWGRLGYDPGLTDSFFVVALERRFPGMPASILYDAWARASRIIPAVNRIHWHDWDFEWAVEGCRGRKGYHRITDSCWKPGGAQVATEIKEHADFVLSKLPDLKKAGNDTEWRHTLGDLEAMAFLGLYYAEKIHAADTRDTQPELAVENLKKAAKYWREYADLAGELYASQLLSKGGYLDWQQGYKDALRDIELLERNQS